MRVVLPRFKMTLLAAGAVMIPSAVWADEHAGSRSIEIFTTARFPVEDASVPPGVRIYRIDALELLDTELSRDLPGDPEQAKQVAVARIGAMAEHFRARAEAGARGIELAHRYQIKKVPAIVFDGGESVIYGVLDLSTATEIYRRHRGG